jgi:hypothetical protein
MHPNPTAQTLNPDVPNRRHGICISLMTAIVAAPDGAFLI